MIAALNRAGKWHILTENGICCRCKSGLVAYSGGGFSNMEGKICFECRKNPTKNPDIESIEIAEITEKEWEAWQLVTNL